MSGETSDNRRGEGERPARRPDVDWLRAFAVLLLVPFHTALVFCKTGMFPLKSGEHCMPLDYFAGIVHQWHMPLLFVLSGAGTWFALCFRSPAQYAKERAKRLLVPLVFGTLVTVPPQVYYQRVNEGRFNGSYLEFYPHFFRGIYPKGNFMWSHLWFVAYLFVFSMIALPLLAHLRREPGRRLIARLAALCEKRGGIFLLALPVAVSEAALRAAFPGLQNLVWDWANFISYLSLFVLGFIIFADDTFQRAIDRDGLLALALGAGSLCFGVALHLTENAPARGYSVGWILFMFLRGFNTWFWIIALLFLGKRLLAFGGPVLRYVAEATYPFYILHQTVIVLIGFYLMKLETGILVRFVLLNIAVIAATILTYDLLVRRTNVTRFLFGMKPKRPKPRRS